METARCRAFLAAAETGSFSKAAGALSYTPSGVNQLVSALEKEFGFPLFRRNTKGVSLAEDPMLALLPRNHPLADAEVYPLANCATDRFIMPARGCDDDVMALFQRTGVTPNVRFTTLESFSVMSMVEQGLGMSVMNKLITEKRICDIAMLPVDPPASITLGIALHSRADLSPAVRRFLKYAVRMLTKQEKHK